MTQLVQSTRLVDMGIKPYLVSTATVEQYRTALIKTYLSKCKTEYTVETNEHAGIGIHKGRHLVSRTRLQLLQRYGILRTYRYPRNHGGDTGD